MTSTQPKRTCWRSSLRTVYDNNYEQFEAYCEMYDIHGRLGYELPEEAWEENPFIQGSTDPEDLKKLPHILEYSRKPTESEIKFGNGATHYRDFGPEDYLKENGEIKKRIHAKDDGLVYTR